ncbi:MAG TPA: MerR family transcriptional regulator [Ktedonobacterales bacterium]
MSYSVGQVAKIARVTVRTLHHYDEIGLLHPSGRLDSGYRSYSMADLERLQRILCYRQLGFPLDQIKAMLDDQDTDPLEHLRRQHVLLSKRISELQRMVATVETLMEARTMGITLEPNELLDVFGDTDPFAYTEEAEQQWGSSTAWAEAQRRTSTYTKDDWMRMQAESAAMMAAFAAAQADGLEPTSARTMALAEEHRMYLERWFYPCSHKMHRGLGDLYANDPRFAANIARFAAADANLAGYLRDAIYANAERSAHTGR